MLSVSACAELHMPVEGWFPTPIFHEDLEGADAVCELVVGLADRLEAPLGKDNPQILGDARSGGNRPDIHQYLHLVPQLAPLFRLLDGPMVRFATELGIDGQRESLFIGRSWLNVVRRGGAIDRHHHVSALFSGVFYVQVPTQQALRFIDPRSSLRRSPHASRMTAFNVPHADFRAAAGSVLLFPGWLDHGMSIAHDSDVPRISVAFDVYSVSLNGQSPPPPPPSTAQRMRDELTAQVGALGLPDVS